MSDFQANVNKNLIELINGTTLTVEFITSLKVKDLITKSEADELTKFLTFNQQTVAASFLFTNIVRKFGDECVEKFYTALRESKNKSVIDILCPIEICEVDGQRIIAEKSPIILQANLLPVEDTELVRKLESTVIIEKPKQRFADVCGLDQAKIDLEQAVCLPIKFPHLFENTEPYKGFLFFGPPGTGKSYLAKAVAGETDTTTFFAISASDLISKYQGESEGLIKNLFLTARKKSPSIIFIDEIDSLALTRSDNDNDSSRRIKTELFVQMDGVNSTNEGVFVMAATNTPYNLDDAILRRFDKLIYVPLPSESDRSAMFSKHFGKEFAESDYVNLAKKTDVLSGSDISKLCKQSRMKPIERLQKAEYFKKTKDGTCFSPCSKDEEGAIPMKLKDIPSSKLDYQPNISLDDVLLTAENAKPSSDPALIQKLEQFAKERAGWNGVY